MDSLLPQHSRLAPTPSGYLHLGNIFSFILTWFVVRKSGGTLLLRIDDLDAARKRPEYVADIFDTLAWLELDYDKGPRSPEEFEDVWSQRHRLPHYQTALERLIQSGSVFACDCSRSQFSTAGANNLYPGTCRHRNLPFDKPQTAIRLDVPLETNVVLQDKLHSTLNIPVGTTTGCSVVRQKDGMPAYLITSVVDDEYFGINSIVRGDDLLPVTAAQLYIAEKLGKIQFCESSFFHHPLLLDTTGTKLSKSAGALSLRALRAKGITPQEIYRRAADFLGISSVNITVLADMLEQ